MELRKSDPSYDHRINRRPRLIGGNSRRNTCCNNDLLQCGAVSLKKRNDFCLTTSPFHDYFSLRIRMNTESRKVQFHPEIRRVHRSDGDRPHIFSVGTGLWSLNRPVFTSLPSLSQTMIRPSVVRVFAHGNLNLNLKTLNPRRADWTRMNSNRQIQIGIWRKISARVCRKYSWLNSDGVLNLLPWKTTMSFQRY